MNVNGAMLTLIQYFFLQESVIGYNVLEQESCNKKVIERKAVFLLRLSPSARENKAIKKLI